MFDSQSRHYFFDIWRSSTGCFDWHLNFNLSLFFVRFDFIRVARFFFAFLLATTSNITHDTLVSKEQIIIMFLTAAPILLLASTSSSVNGFGPLHPSRHPSGRFQISRFTKSIEHTSVLLNAKEKDDGATSKGMEDAFKQLEDLKSLGDDVFSDLDRKAQD